MEVAFEALDANDDNVAVSTAFDRVFSSEVFGDPAAEGIREKGGKFAADLDFLNGGKDDD